MLDLSLLPTVALGAALVWIFRLVGTPYLFPSTISRLPGPSRNSFFSGNLEAILNNEPGKATLDWHNQYGRALRFFGFSGQERLSLMDPTALHHIMMRNNYTYENAASKILNDVLGPGLIVAEGDAHKRQRKLVNPAFSPAQIGRLEEVMVKVARDLRDRLRAEVTEDAASKDERPSRELNIAPWFTRAALDILGLAAFAHDFGTLEGHDDELTQALEHGLTKTAGHRLTKAFTLANVLIAWFPFLRHIPAPTIKAMRVSLDATMCESRRLLGELRKVTEGGGVNEGKEVLSLLLKSSDRVQENGLSDDEIVAQMATFVVAGHETTATVLGWVVHELVQNPAVQTRLREELEQAVGEGVEGLPFLDAVIKETLRIHPPVPALMRRAVADDVIPLSEPITLSDGTTTDTLPITKGQVIYIPIASLQRLPELWGDDAAEFRPERFLEEDLFGRKDKTKYALWGDLLVFGGGPRSCVGYRFALAELKHILSALVSDMQFASCAAPTKIIGRVSPLIARPFVQSQEDEGSTMPVKITLMDCM